MADQPNSTKSKPKQPAPKSSKSSEGKPEQTPSIEVPEEVVQALGGQPIPPPPMPQNLAEQKAARKDAGGLLAPPRLESRATRAAIEQIRDGLKKLVGATDRTMRALVPQIERALADAETCQLEGFDPQAAKALLQDLAATLDRHLG